MEKVPDEVTLLLRGLDRGDPYAESKILAIVYAELRGLAGKCMRLEGLGQTIHPTALVHEAYLGLVTQQGATWRNRANFLPIAARAMRRLLVDLARERGQGKRATLPLDDAFIYSSDLSEEVLALDIALSKLEDLDLLQCRIVELRRFCGLTVEETSEVLNIPQTTVKREWNSALAWLSHEIGKPK